MQYLLSELLGVTHLNWTSEKSDLLLMAPFRRPLCPSLTPVSHPGAEGSHEITKLRLPHLKVFQLSLEYWGLWRLSNRPFTTGQLQRWSCHILKEWKDFVLLLDADSDPMSIGQWESKQWSHVIVFKITHKTRTTCSHSAPSDTYFNSLPWDTPNPITGFLQLEGVRELCYVENYVILKY